MLPHDGRGSGEPVVLLHAGVGDRSMWHEHLPILAGAGFRAIALDLPGFGEADISAGPQAPWEDVLGTLDELGAVPASLVGNSFGAAVALRAAAVAPEAVSALMLVSPPPIDAEPSPELSAAWDAEQAAIERGDIEAAVAAVLDAWLRPDAPAAVRERLAAMQRRALEIQIAAGDVAEAPDPLARGTDALETLRIPVLAAAGEYDMPDFRAGAREIAELMPLGEFRTIEAAGHLAPLEAPAAFTELLLEFLRARP